jgi:hypothetical protein
MTGTVRYSIALTPDTEEGYETSRVIRADAVRRIAAMNAIPVPEGKTPAEMYGKKKPAKLAETEVSEPLVDSRMEAAPPTPDEGNATPTPDEVNATPAPNDTTAGDGGNVATASSGYDDLSYARIKWVSPSAKVRQLRVASYETGREYEERAAKWNAQVQQMMATDPEPETKPEPYVIPEYEFQPTQWRERKPLSRRVAPRATPVAEQELDEFAEAASGRENEEDVALDLDDVPEVAPRPERDLPPHLL